MLKLTNNFTSVMNEQWRLKKMSKPKLARLC